jgi:hypothetical protein
MGSLWRQRQPLRWQAGRWDALERQTRMSRQSKPEPLPMMARDLVTEEESEENLAWRSLVGYADGKQSSDEE